MIQCSQLYKLVRTHDWLLLNFARQNPSPKLLFMILLYFLLIKPFWKKIAAVGNTDDWIEEPGWRVGEGGLEPVVHSTRLMYGLDGWYILFFTNQANAPLQQNLWFFFCLLYHRGKKAYVFQTYRQLCNHLIFVLDMVFPIKIKLYSWATTVEIGVTFFHK